MFNAYVDYDMHISDHFPVQLSIDEWVDQMQRCKNYRPLMVNNLLLPSSLFAQHVISNAECLHALSCSAMQKWMVLVKNMQYVICTCGKYHASKDRRQMQDIQCRLSQLKQNSELNPLSQSDEIDTLQCIQELQNHDHKKGIRARFLYLCQSLKDQAYTSKEFLKQLHSKLTRNAVAFIESEDGTMICKGKDIIGLKNA